jgi:hypothetical protein
MIANELGVSLASASTWTRGTQPPEPSPPRVAPPEPEDLPTARCGRCAMTLPISAYHWSRGRRQHWCKSCRRIYMKERGDLHRRQTRAARDKRRAIARRCLLRLLATGRCKDCGLADPVVLEFDHVGAKRGAISNLVKEGYRLSRIKEELASCELVCANCHRRRTGLRARSWRIDPDWRAEGDSRPLRRRNLLFIVEYLRSAGCVDCAETDPVVLDFDHVGVKRNSVVRLAYKEHSIASIMREVAECEIRCANCHRRRTIAQRPDHLRHHLLQPL